jgi:hypothetical protein
MKPNAVFLSAVFGVIALVTIIWIGRYPVSSSDEGSPKKPEEIGPPISRTGPYPKAVADSTTHDFGVMLVKEKGSHKFTIRNEGEAPLVLMARKEDATCQCTIGELGTNDAVPPGGSVDVTLSWEIKVLMPQFRQSASIRTNDPKNRIIKFEVTGKVEDALNLVPPNEWDIGEVLESEPTLATGSLQSAVIEHFTIDKFQCTNPLVNVTWEPLTPEQLENRQVKSGYVVRVEVAPGSPIGPFAEEIKLFTSVELLPELKFRIRGHRPGPIEFFGPGYRGDANYLMLGEFNAKKGKEVTLTAFVRDMKEELQLLKAEQKFNSLELDFRRAPGAEDSPVQRYLLTVRVPPGALQDRQRGNAERLDLFFNHPRAERVRITVDFLASEFR